MNFHECDEAVDLRLVWSEPRENAAEAESIFAKRGTHPVFTGGGRVALIEDKVDNLEDGRKSNGEIGTARNFKGNARFGERAFGADDALGDGWFGNEKGASDFRGGEAAEKSKSERDACLRGQDWVTGDEYEAEKIVAEVGVICGVECGVEICHGGFLLGLEFAA